MSIFKRPNVIRLVQKEDEEHINLKIQKNSKEKKNTRPPLATVKAKSRVLSLFLFCTI